MGAVSLTSQGENQRSNSHRSSAAVSATVAGQHTTETDAARLGEVPQHMSMQMFMQMFMHVLMHVLVHVLMHMSIHMSRHMCVHMDMHMPIRMRT